MENEIKVNDFVRLKDGTIAKVIEIKNQDTDILNWYCLDNDMGTMDRSIVKHSSNLIDIIEDYDFCKIEFYSPRYKKRGTRIFEVSKIDEYITFENMHCDLLMKNGEWGNHDKELKPVIKEIYTKEMMESISYKVKE